MSGEKEEGSNKSTEKGEARGKSENIITGELSCIIIFSDEIHVEHINTVLYFTESILKIEHFRPQRLGDEIRSSEDYLEKLENMIEKCVLGVVILDGFRPNVLFEFGFLIGKKKPIIILQSKNASINIKSLYIPYEKSCEKAGLTRKQFDKMKNPLIDLSKHLSDFGGKHIAYFDWRVRESSADHPSVVLKNELKKNKTQVAKEIENVALRNIMKL
jgi:nucleoside 2-deoxyribosyltransferase